MKISAVIIGRNVQDYLKKCLQSVKPTVDEMIYVDSGSSDMSCLIAEGEGARVVKSDPPFNAAKARNKGAEAALNDYLLFIDGDTIFNPAFKELALPFLDENTVVYGRREEINPNLSIYTRILNVDWQETDCVGETAGGDFYISKKAFQDVNGFDTDLDAGEDPDLCQRLKLKGYSVHFINVLMTKHDLNMRTFKEYWTRAFRTGYAYAKVSSRYWNTKPALWKSASLRNWIKGSFLILMLLISIPLGILVILLLALIKYTFSKKEGDTLTLLLWSLHCQFIHFPVLFGQISYWLGRLK
jgi:glycosyltransferase involved in cell wall biosynthesis